MEVNGHNKLTPEQQDANAFLRERYLYTLSSLCGKAAKMYLHGGSEVVGTIKAFDYTVDNVIVENLKTPSGETIKMSIIRASDIIAINFE